MWLFDKLPNFLPFGKEQIQAEYFFALNIGFGRVDASVWGIEGKGLHIINTSSLEYSSEEELADKANTALDEALADFEFEPTKILFGVPDSWLQDDDLKPEFLVKLRKLVKELDATPMAYVSITHAISHLLQKLEGVPTTAILVNIADPLTVTVIKAGKIISSKQQKRSGNLPEDIEKALLTFSDIEVLPSKILIYGPALDPSSQDFSSGARFKQELLSYSWMSQLPFLHIPKIDVLDEGISIKAISFAGASEINPDIHLHPNDLEVRMSGAESPQRVSRPLPQMESNLDDSGFVEGDIEKVSKKKSLGVMEKVEDLTDEDNEEYATEERSVMMHSTGREIARDEDYQTQLPERTSLISSLKSMLLSPFGIFGREDAVSKPNFLVALLRGKSFLIALLILVLFLLAAVFLPKGRVVVFVDPRTLERETSVVADPAVTAVDEANKKIPGKTIQEQVNGNQKGTASGKKKVGDPAKGGIIIYNKTTSPKTFSSGTVLQGQNNLNFILDTSVNIASQSAVEGGISFGKATANVTASEIGPDGNLPAGKELSIKGQSSSDFSAKVDSAFSGGLSKDVTVVTSDDQKKLLAVLSSELRKKAAEQLQGKLSGDQKILAEGLSEKIIKQSFSKNVNDQASEFSLNLTVDYKGTAYSDNDLKLIVSKLVETNVPEGYDLDLSKTETQADVSKIEKDGKLIFTAKFKAKLMPKLDINKIRKEIAGKTPDEVEAKLKSYENVIGADIHVTPNLPKPFARLPFLARNISVEVTTK